MVKKQGGKRRNSGRKPLADKKVQLPIYIPESWISIIGRSESQAMCYSMLEKVAGKLEKK